MLTAELKDVPSAQRLAVATARWQQLSHSEAAAYHSQAVTFNASHTPADTASANTAAYTHKLLLQMSNLVRKNMYISKWCVEHIKYVFCLFVCECICVCMSVLQTIVNWLYFTQS